MFSLLPQSSCLGKTAPNQTHNGKFHPVPPYKVQPFVPPPQQYKQKFSCTSTIFFIYYGISNIFSWVWFYSIHKFIWVNRSFLETPGGRGEDDRRRLMSDFFKIKYDICICVFFSSLKRKRDIFLHVIYPCLLREVVCPGKLSRRMV